jgi:hypothetical protein
MPNWCNNSIEIRGDKEQIDSFEKFLDENNGKEWFNFILPCPEELKNSEDDISEGETKRLLTEKYGYSDWYSWSLDNWGCKWNCDTEYWQRDDDVITFWFDSHWSPPLSLYDEMEKQGFEVIANYHEEGMCFVGRYSEGSEHTFEYSDLDSLEDIPVEIVEYWGLREMIEVNMDTDDYIEDDSDEVKFTGDNAKVWIKGLLKDGVVEVTFIKSDGTERVMKCTLKDEVISEHWTPKLEDGQHKHSEDVLPVFDVEAKGWRSFRFDSIKSVDFTLE